MYEKTQQVVFFPRENNSSGMLCRNHFRWVTLHENHSEKGGETDLRGSRGSWVWSRDSGDPVSQVGAVSSPQAQTTTVKVTLVRLPQGTSQRLTAPHTGEHLDVDIVKCYDKCAQTNQSTDCVHRQNQQISLGAAVEEAPLLLVIMLSTVGTGFPCIHKHQIQSIFKDFPGPIYMTQQGRVWETNQSELQHWESL